MLQIQAQGVPIQMFDFFGYLFVVLLIPVLIFLLARYTWRERKRNFPPSTLHADRGFEVLPPSEKKADL